MLASKFFDDVYYNNAYYARVGGISNSEVNSLEMEMLRMISFSLFVPTEQYERYRGSLYSHVTAPLSPQIAPVATPGAVGPLEGTIAPAGNGGGGLVGGQPSHGASVVPRAAAGACGAGACGAGACASAVGAAGCRCAGFDAPCAAAPQSQPSGAHQRSPEYSGSARKRGSPGAGCSCSNQDTAGAGNVVSAATGNPLVSSALYAPGGVRGMAPPTYPGGHHVGMPGMQPMADDPRAMPFNGMVGGGMVGGGMGGAAAGGGGSDMMID